jgi:ATP-dependent Clp protease ATP-binding subunit ClpC
MTSLRMTKTLKSAVAVIVSGSLFFTTAVTPVAAQTFRAGTAADAGSAARASFTPSTVNGVQPLPANVFGSASLVPALSPAPAPTALALPLPAAATPDAPKDASNPAAQQPVEQPNAPIKTSDAGPRWVKTEAKPETNPQPASADAGPRWVKTGGEQKSEAGPRWVAPQKTGIRAVLAKYLPFLAKSGAETFDGAASRENGVEAAPASAKGELSHAAGGLSKASARSAEIINDRSIPTPEAARRVGEIRHSLGTPIWAKIVAPLSVVAAVAVAIHFGAVPVLTLAVGLVVSVLAHEIAHIAVLHRLGDHTAEHAGSHSMNPFAHIDAVKTVIVPALSLALSSIFLPFPILLGAGKPVDADFNNLHSPFGGPRSARNAFWVAAAGPATNLLIAGLAFGAVALLPAGGTLALVALGLAKMNLALAAFNMLPLPQLDGGKILASILPERFYAKWVFNPKVERGYQGVFRRLYEGPSNVLTWLADAMGVRTQKGVNRLANTVTFTALAAFYAAAYFHFALALPLLFLALPCSYDYWCIREKVRSEAAVQDLMELMSQWSAVIVQIAEDLGLDSEVSAYETEHAMKNALETLVDEMMAKEEFRALSDDQKLEALMKEYPDKAAEFLKQKAMPEDSIEKIKAVLADPRNGPFYERLKKWFKEHEIFARWDNQHQQGKLKDAMKNADKEKSSGGGAVDSRSLPARALSALLNVLPAPAIGDGPGDAAPVDPLAKVEANEAASVNVIAVDIDPTTSQAEIERLFTGLDYTATAASAGYYRIEIANRTDAPLIARRMARDAAVQRVVVNPALRERMNLPVAEPVSTRPAFVRPAWASKVKRDARYSTKIRIVFTNAQIARREFGHFSQPKSLIGGPVVEVTVHAPSEAAELVSRLAEAAYVKTVIVSPTVHRLLLNSLPASASAPVEPDARWESKLAQVADVEGKVRVVFGPALDSSEISARLSQYGGRTRLSDRSWDITAANSEVAAEIARALAEDEHVLRVVVSPAVHARLTGAPAAPVQNELPFEPSTERTPATEDPAPEEAPAPQAQPVPAPEAAPAPEPVPAPPVKPSLPAKVVSHGKAEYGVNVVLVKFAEGTSASDIGAALARHGQNTLYHHGDLYTLSAASAEQAREKAVALAAEASVETVKVHPNVAAKMTEDAEPYPDAQGFDHDRAILVEFRAGVTPETIKEYAEVRRLQLVHPNFRGSERSALLEVPKGADIRATLQMLVDETAAPHSAAESVRPFQEQPGEAELKPSEKAAAAAVEESKPDAAAIPRRDPAQAWQEHLQNVTLSDGKSKLTDKQVQLMSVFLKPLARQPDEKRPPIVGRGDEIKRMLPIVTSPRGMRNSVILVGEAGVGKTAVPEGLAEMIEDAEHATAQDGEAFLQFQRLKGRWLVELDINKVLTQEDPVGVLGMILDLLPRLNQGGPSRGNDVIVLMDEIQKFFLDNAGQKIANTLKGPLRDGKISVIATTTRAEFKKFIEGDDAFRRRFEKIDVEEPTVPQTIAILRAMKGWLQKLHDAVIPDEALVSAAKLADQFDKTNFNPDKAIKAVQDAAELSRPDNLRAAITLDLRETWGELVVAANEARQALVDKGIASTLALPVDMYNKIAGLVQKAESLYKEREAVADGKGKVTTEVVKRVIAAKTGIASGQLNLGEDDAARYTRMEDEIGKRVVNQDRALMAIANAVRRNKAGLSNPNRPMGKFLLTGPTGVGKTYLAKELARFLFNDPEAMIRMDMSEYMEEHTAQRLTGSPPGYVGYGEGGQLTEAVRKKPYSVILFDEVEKAHPKVFDVLLQILDDGRLTDGQGRTVDFKNTVIIMTSNSGMGGVDGEKYAKLLAKIDAHNAALAAGKADEPGAKPLPTAEEVNQLWDEEIDLMVGAALKERFRPEFLNRLDEDPLSKNKWIRVNRLRPQDIAKIATIQLKEFQTLLADRHDTDITFDDSVVNFLSVDGYSPLYGARPMTAAIEKNIIDPMAQWILKEAEAGKNDVRGAAILVTYENGKITFAASKKPEKNTARTTVQGASEAVAAEVFSLIERLSGTGEGEEPTENLFDLWMRKSRPETGKTTATESNGNGSGTRTRAFLAPGTGLAVNGAAISAEHNNSKKKDGKVRIAIQGAREFAGNKGWEPAVLDILDAPSGQVGEGWLKQIVKLMKEQATKAGAAAPVEISARFETDALQVAVSGAYALTEDDQRALAMHFSGAPPASYLAAQQKADNLNLSARLLWDHNLLDLYRRLSAIPGARMGFKTGPEGTQIWLEIKRSQAPPALSAAAPSAAAAPDALAGTPHQQREMAKTRDLMLRVIDQSKLKENERDGHAMKIAAAEGYAMLAQPSDAATARGWISAHGWAGEVTQTEKKETWGSVSKKIDVEVGENWPLAMAAALVLERFGGAEDVEVLENMARRVTGTAHNDVPVHNALVGALSAIYTRLGLGATRKAMSRAAQITEGRTVDITDAAKRALGTVGMPADIDEAKLDADGYLAIMKRLGRTAELHRIFRDTTFWGTNSAEPVRQAALMLAGETEKGDEALNRLKNMMKTQTTYSRTAFAMSRAWASIVSREGLTKGLGDAIKRYMDTRGVKDYSAGSTWTVLYAYVLTAQMAGGADALEPLEELMNASPSDIASVNEQAYFNSPEAWARVLVRSGKFEEYARSQGLNADGSPKPSKLQEMLTNQTRPMLAAGALRAIAYARDPNFSRRAVAPKGDLPDIQPEPPSPAPSSPRGPSNPRFNGWHGEMF